MLQIVYHNVIHERAPCSLSATAISSRIRAAFYFGWKHPMSPRQNKRAPRKKQSPACTRFARIQTRSNIFSILMAHQRPSPCACPPSKAFPCPRRNSSTTGIWIPKIQHSPPFSSMGFGCEPEKAMPVSVGIFHASADQPHPFAPAPDLRYWSMVCALALETLAAHKLVPVIVNEGKEYFARWLPVLDSPKDAARLKQLEDAHACCVSRCSLDLRQFRPEENLIEPVFSTPSAIRWRVNGENLPRRSFTQ